MVIEFEGEELNQIVTNSLEKFKVGKQYCKGNSFHMLIQELVVDKTSKINKFLEENDISSVKITKLNNVSFAHSFIEYPSFTISLYKNKDSVYGNYCLGSVFVVVYPNCCGICIMYGLSAYSSGSQTYNLVMTTSMYLARLVGYAKTQYTDISRNRLSYGDRKVKEYFKYDVETKQITNPLWTVIDELVSHRTQRTLTTFTHSMEELDPDKYLDYLISYYNSCKDE